MGNLDQAAKNGPEDTRQAILYVESVCIMFYKEFHHVISN